MKRFFFVSFILLVASAPALAQERRFAIDDLLKVRRVGDPQVSPKGDFVAFTITDPDKTANKSMTQIYLVPLSGGEPRQPPLEGGGLPRHPDEPAGGAVRGVPCHAPYERTRDGG